MAGKSKPEEMRDRTKRFAIGVVRLFRTLPKTEEARVVGKQLLRSATSVGANYRAVCLARSHAEFVSKMNVVLEEADECLFWLELMEEADILKRGDPSGLRKEAQQLSWIFGASLRTAKGSRNDRK